MRSMRRPGLLLGLGSIGLMACLQFSPVEAQQPEAPLELFKNALKKVLPQNDTAPPQSLSRAESPLTGRQAGTAAAAEPFSMEDGASDPSATPAVKLGDYKALPSVVGIHLSMPLHEALNAMRAQYKGAVQLSVARDYPGYGRPAQMEFGVGINVVGATPETLYVEATPPPEEQRIWRVNRRVGNYNHPMLHGALLGSLRQKYGPETVAFHVSALEGVGPGLESRNDAEIGVLWWIFDEQGRPAPLPAGGVEEVNNMCLSMFRGRSTIGNHFSHGAEQCRPHHSADSLQQLTGHCPRRHRSFRRTVGAFYVDMLEVALHRAPRAPPWP